jgi:hypothetical protein
MKKKLLIISLFVIICAAFAFADAYKDVNNYINQGLSDQNVIKIKELAPELTQQQKESIYRWRKVDTVFPFLENTFLGFGSGSFSQGDSTTESSSLLVIPCVWDLWATTSFPTVGRTSSTASPERVEAKMT